MPVQAFSVITNGGQTYPALYMSQYKCINNEFLVDDTSGTAHPIIISGNPCPSSVFGGIDAVFRCQSCDGVIHFDAGDNYPVEVTILDDGGNPIDITGWEIAGTFAGQLVTGTLTSPIQGNVSFVIDASSLSAGYYEYQIYTISGAARRTIAAGDMVIS